MSPLREEVSRRGDADAHQASGFAETSSSDAAETAIGVTIRAVAVLLISWREPDVIVDWLISPTAAPRGATGPRQSLYRRAGAERDPEQVPDDEEERPDDESTSVYGSINATTVPMPGAPP